MWMAQAGGDTVRFVSRGRLRSVSEVNRKQKRQGVKSHTQPGCRDI